MSNRLNIVKTSVPLIIILVMSALFGCAGETPTTPISTTITPSTSSAPGSNQNSITINLSAQNMAFNTRTITVPPGVAVTLLFENKDRLPHNLSVYSDKSAATTIFIGEIITGPKTITYRFTAPSKPGTYFFRCDPHPAVMFGDFIVTSPGS